MNDRIFWSRAANYGLLLGLAVFAVSLLSWAFKLENSAWISEAMLFAVLLGGIWITAGLNVEASGEQGYSYGRSVGFVFALMLFTAVVAGVGDFLLRAYIAPEYYLEQLQRAFDMVAASGGGLPSTMQTLDTARKMSEELMTNPMFLIFSEMINLGIKGGFLGIVMSAFLKKDSAVPQNRQDDELR